jgi:hypothetical protein
MSLVMFRKFSDMIGFRLRSIYALDMIPIRTQVLYLHDTSASVLGNVFCFQIFQIIFSQETP